MLLFFFVVLAQALPLIPLKPLIPSIPLRILQKDALPTRTVTTTLLFTLSGPAQILFQDAFCGGDSFSIFLDGIFVTTVPGSVPKLCGVDISSYQPVVSPLFAKYELDVDAGSHNVTVIVDGSPILGNTAALRITFFPDSVLMALQQKITY